MIQQITLYSPIVVQWHVRVHLDFEDTTLG